MTPSSRKSEVYRKLLLGIRESKDPAEAQARFRAVADADFWFFVRYVSSFGRYTIREAGHPMMGEPWADHPWIFARCREIQKAIEEMESGVFWNWPRFHFKTELITKLATLWELCRDALLTNCLLTYKVDQTGAQMFLNLRSEIEKNEVLLTHWPDRFSPNTSDYPLWTNTAFTILRPLGPKEPSVSIHGVYDPPTSGHYRRIKADDAVTDKTVENAQTMVKTYRAMKVLTPLQEQDTIFWWIGTIWDIYDPYMEGLKDGRFSRHSFSSSFDEEGEPILHTKAFLDTWRRDMGEYLFSANMLNAPVAKGDQNFHPSWLDYRYKNPPIEEAKGKTIYVFSDISSGEEESDFTAIFVVGLGEDRKFYALDLIRDRLSLNELLDAWFAIAKKWSPETVWVESFGDTAYLSTLEREMELRKKRFRARKIPRIGSQKSSRSKEGRIVKLQPMMARGEIWWPADGFGHGSPHCGDDRDTFEQFRRDEYNFWTPIKGSVAHDDGLDCMSWIAQPEMQRRLSFPETYVPTEETDPLHPDVRLARQRRETYSAVSGWAF